MSLPLKIALAALAIYAGVGLAAWLGQRRLMYFPNPSQIAPGAAGLSDVEEKVLRTPDGHRLVVWRAQAQPGQPTILYFHGNGGGLANRAGRFGRYRELGFGLFALSYRGYSGSTGSPSEAANLKDAALAYDTLVAEGVDPGDIFIYGESLGSGVAVATAARKRAGGVILDAPYTSVVDIAARRYPILPVRTLLIDRYESDKRIRQVKAPVLILHGEKDRVIPAEMGRALYALANEPKKLVLYPEGHHIDLDDFGAVKEVRRWIGALRGVRR